MRCHNAKRLLYLGATRRETISLRLHLLGCASCRQEARTLSDVNQALAVHPRHEPSPLLVSRILAVTHGSTAATPTKEKRTMKRVVYAAAAMLAVAVLATIALPGRGKKDDALTILAGVAQAAEEATSLHQSGRTGNPQGLLPGRFDSWFGTSAMATRFYDEGSSVLVASRADLDARQWWFYDGRSHTKYIADLSPVMSEAARAIPRLMKYYIKGHFEQDPVRMGWPDAKTSVTTETRAGRPVKVVTIDRQLDIPDNKPPIHVTDRYVYEVDPATEHLLATRRYWVQKDGTQVQLDDTDTIAYDTPIPNDAELLSRAKEVHTATANASIVRERGGTFLVLTFEGKRLNEGSMLTTMEVPSAN